MNGGIDEIENLGVLLTKHIDECVYKNGCNPKLYESILSQSSIEIYQKLLGNREFVEAVNHAQSCTRFSKRYWMYQALRNTESFQIGILTLYRSKKVPLHDHPDAFGAQYVISGKVSIKKYQYLNDKAEKKSIVELQKVADLKLSQGEVSSYQPVRGNIHQLESLTERTVLLSMVIHPYDLKDRAWYFPIYSSEGSKELLFNRLKKT